MKKVLCILLVMVMLILSACGGSGDNNSVADSSENSSVLDVSDIVSGILSGEASEEVPEGYIKVPDISSMTPDEAKEALKEAGFTVKVKEKPHDSVPEGEIIETDLEIGKAYEKGTRIWLYVSTGKGLAGQSLVPKPSALVASRPVLEVGANSDYTPVNYEFMKACWLSQYDMKDVYQNGGLQRDEADFRDKIQKLFAAIWERGINTIFVQLRPNGDSFYPSAYYCPSNYVTGSYAIDFKYDPLAIMVEEAHAVGLSIHGWINPLRCMESGTVNLINITYGVRQFEQEHMGDYIVNEGARLYLNPGREEARQLIVNGATEIVRYYDVDGVHIDDYFYPTREERFDETSFKDQDEYEILSMYRFANINKLVMALYSGVKAENPNVLFGISPAGNPDVVSQAYADYNTWLSREGFVDYIMPQLYWGMQHKTVPFDKTFDRWASYIKVPGIRLIAGMDLNNAALGYAGEGTAEWNNSRSVLKSCLNYAISTGDCNGYSLFSLGTLISISNFEQVPTTKEEMKNFFAVSDMFGNKLMD